MADTDYAALLASSPTNTILNNDQLVIVRGGVPRAFNGTLPAISASGAVSILGGGDIFEVGAGARRLRHSADSGGIFVATGAGQTGSGFYYDEANKGVRCYTDSAERWRVDAFGNLLVGTQTAAFSGHTINKPVSATTAVLTVQSASTGFNSAIFLAADAHGYSTAGAAMWVGRYSGSGRGLNVGGTVNAGGSDYAEYMRKAVAYVETELLKGQLLGVNDDGELTPKWSEAHSWIFKTYDPSYVGGDKWAAHLGEKPEAPAPISPAPVEPVTPEALAAWTEEEAAFDAAQAEFETKLSIYETGYAEAEKAVDRAAFCGQVPVIVTGGYAPGQYLVAEEGPDDTIICRAWDRAALIADRMAGGDMEYRVVGKVWAIREVKRNPADTSPDAELVTRAWANVLLR